MNPISQEEREVVIARLEISASGVTLYSGSNTQSYDKQQLIELIKEGNPVGDEYVKIDLDFIRAMKSGELMRTLTTA